MNRASFAEVLTVDKIKNKSANFSCAGNLYFSLFVYFMLFADRSLIWYQSNY